MNKAVMDYLERKMMGQDGRRGRGRDRRDYEDNRDYEDGRRGVRGSGRGRGRGRDRADSADYADYADYEMDSRDYRDNRDSRDGRRGGRDRRDRRDYEDDYVDDYEDGRDYHSPLKLTKSDIHHWKKKLENADGTRGEHYDMQQIMQVAERINVRFNEFDEKEFCLLVNVMYSDYGHVIKKYVGPEKELTLCAELAKAFFDDPDGPDPSEKLALYYHCIACNAEV